MGDGPKENPYTREDVLRLIEQNGGTAEGLDLSQKEFEEGIDLRELHLSGIIMKSAILAGANLADVWLEGAHLERADLSEADLSNADLEVAHLEGADLSNANLEGALMSAGTHLEEADLIGTNLEGADLSDAHLERARLEGSQLKKADLSHAHLEGADLSDVNLADVNLSFAHLQGVSLRAVEFTRNTKMENVDWGNHVLGEENVGNYDWAVDIYTKLKIWYTNAAIYDTAAKFFFREMTVKRKMLKWWPNPIPRAWSKFLSILCGYGERPLRVVVWAASVVLGLAAAYYFWGSFNSSSFWDTLYYSAASFTALGYGNWAPQPTGWAKAMGAAEAFIGVFTMALFLVTFIRKMTR